MGGPGKVDGKRCLATDNFQPVKFVVNGKEYPSAENYFQCIKCLHENEHEHIRLNGGTGNDAWSAGQSVTIRRDWEKVKVQEMYNGNKAKFEQNESHRQELLATVGRITFDASSSFWCKWNGLIMELIREELRSPEVRNQDVINDITNQMTAYYNSQ